MKRKIMFIALFALFASADLFAAPILINGRYKGHSSTPGGGLTIRCGWFGQNCAAFVNGVIWVDNYDHTIGTYAPVAPDNQNEEMSEDELFEGMEAGSQVAEDGEMETWYQFSSIVFTPN